MRTRLFLFALAASVTLSCCHSEPDSFLVSPANPATGAGESPAGGSATPGTAKSGPTAPEETGPRWIWYPEGDPGVSAPAGARFFRKTLDFARLPHSAFLWVVADNNYVLFCNGKRIGSGKYISRPEEYDITNDLVLGKNVVAIRAGNQGGPAGLLVEIALLGRGGQIEEVDSDSTWKSAPDAKRGWKSPDFDDAQWTRARVLEKSLPDPWTAAARSVGRIVALDLHGGRFSPDGDGYRDQLRIHLENRFAPDRPATVWIENEKGKRLAHLGTKDRREETLTWDGKDRKGQTVPDGNYECVAEVDTGGYTFRIQRSFVVDTSFHFTRAKDRVKDLFPIGVWFDGRVEGINCPKGYRNVPRDKKKAAAYYEANFKDIRDHHIDIVVVPNTPPEYRQILLNAADRVGVRVVLELVELADRRFGGRYCVRNPDMIQDGQKILDYVRRIVAPLKNHPSLLCYQVLDEPPASLFDNFNLAIHALATADPRHPSFSCLCFEKELPRTAALDTQMIVFDRYPLRKPSRPGDYDFRNFIPLLDSLNRNAGKRPYWMVLQTCAMDRKDGLRYPSPAEIRVMTWLSLAHNAKGIFFFLYNSFTQKERLEGLVDLDLHPHPIYAEVAKLAAELKQLSPLLLSIQPSVPRVEPAQGFDVQSFTDPKGKDYVFVTNLNVLEGKTFWGRIVPGPGGNVVRLRNVLTGDAVAATKQTDRTAFSVPLAPGEGTLLALEMK